MKLALLLILIFCLTEVFAVCNEGQIDINTASLSELDELYGIGPAKAQAIIDARPYESIDDLINANGIGEVTLQNIKEEGLACVSDEKESTPTTETQTKDDETKSEEEPKTENKIINFDLKEEESPVQGEVVNLNPKTIKSENALLDNKKDYGKYFLIAFGVILVGLFFIKPRKRKNEWRK